MCKFKCELCGKEVMVDIKGEKLANIKCPICHRNGRCVDDIFVPTLIKNESSTNKHKE